MQTQSQIQTGENLNLYFEARKLLNKDINSASDPQLFLYLVNQSGSSQLMGTSEIVKDTLNPKFQQFFQIFYNFERRTFLEVQIYDIDKHSKDFLGKVQFELGELVGKKDCKLEKKLNDKYNKPTKQTMIVGYEKAVKSKFQYDMKFKCQQIEDIEWFSKSDPFLKFFKHRNQKIQITHNHNYQDPDWILVYQSEFYKDNLNPSFNKIHVQDYKFCYGNPNHPIKIEVWDYSKRGKHSLIGYLFTTINDMQKQKNLAFMSKRKKGKNAGKLILEEFSQSRQYDFLDYLQGGVFLNTMMGIDFTLSNIEPHKPQSLHYISQQPNQYQLAIWAITNIIQNYDIDKMIPVYGFGGYYNNQVNHCFPLTGDYQQCEVFQAEGVLNLYNNFIGQCRLGAPTIFTPMIYQAMNICKQSNNMLSYLILVIFTDGIITDMQQTIDAIVEASYFPLSIVIIGIGNDSFSSMERLDSDNKLLQSSTGKKAWRDIVQFVPFKKLNLNPEMLARETLAEIPHQVEQFYKLQKIKPNIQH